MVYLTVRIVVRIVKITKEISVKSYFIDSDRKRCREYKRSLERC